MSESIIGIDLGTTNSEVAIIQDGRPVVLPDADGEQILPSVVGLTEDGRLLVGKAARNQYALYPERTIKSIKRQMGQDVKVPLGDQEYSPQEISAMIVRTLKQRAEHHLGGPVNKAVITVPAYFNDSQKQATVMAGQLAGLEEVRILHEPTAAALTYETGEASERVLVYDLGGGTFDVSVVQVEGRICEVLSTEGDTHLGGDDFDELLLNRVCDRFRAEHNVDLRENRVSRSRVLRAVETAKVHLSDHPFTRIEEEFITVKDGVDLHLNMEVTREEFEGLIRPLLERTLDKMQSALEAKDLTASDIDRVVLVGGSTRVPLITELLTERLGRVPHKEVHPDLCVAMGAAVQAGIIGGQDVGAVLVDVTPHSLGIKCLESGVSMFDAPFPYRFAAIIERNSTLPRSSSQVFRTVVDGQERVDIEIYQGESEDVRNNHRIGRFVVEGLAPVEAGNPILVQLDLNVDGLLTVSAREKATGLEKRITIENALAEFEREERDAAVTRLSRLWREAAVRDDEEWDDDDEGWDDGDVEGGGDSAATSPVASEPVPELASGPREGQRETVQARALIEKAERLRGAASPEDQEEIDRLTGAVEAAINNRDWATLQTTSAELSDVLFYLEDV